ncbi:hypothetical protein [Falsirhodobacter sp. 20TX0035]|uniref:hypothetical protein n=1 Tax=Falsirhodobacter sp. 20TX0035 TaxID=3022019 RepID=UPI00232EF280|nr:hypothetical protein [Falsirhodobacter sp. 20TX0035]MDB6453229.1 hypothetical protein [Falsirhodobacter sp. 20TX0035]
MNMDLSIGEASRVDLLAETERLYREVAEELAVATRRVSEGDMGEVAGAMRAMKDLRAAFQMVMEERTRVEKLRKQAGGVVNEYALDLDAARDEIGRRLARLRGAG